MDRYELLEDGTERVESVPVGVIRVDRPVRDGDERFPNRHERRRAARLARDH